MFVNAFTKVNKYLISYGKALQIKLAQTENKTTITNLSCMWWATWATQMERTGRYRFWSRRGTGILSLAWCYTLWNGCWKYGLLWCSRSSCWSLSWSPCNAGDHHASRLVTVPRKLSRCPARSHPAPRGREASVHLYQNKPALHYQNWQLTKLLVGHFSTEQAWTVYKFNIWVHRWDKFLRLTCDSNLNTEGLLSHDVLD